MYAGDFVDYYEILEVGPNASSDAIERQFRILARRYHPDNQASGDRSLFDLILEAHGTLRDPSKRSRYDLDYQHQLSARWSASDSGGGDGSEGDGDAEADKSDETYGIDRDSDIQNRLLTMLYIRRRTNVREPGIGDAELERLSGCTPEHLDFHLWYLKEKGWISRGEDGLLAITIDGVDRATQVHQKMITDQS
jgi:curved DNA-binding protein CbpA